MNVPTELLIMKCLIVEEIFGICGFLSIPESNTNRVFFSSVDRRHLLSRSLLHSLLFPTLLRPEGPFVCLLNCCIGMVSVNESMITMLLCVIMSWMYVMYAYLTVWMVVIYYVVRRDDVCCRDSLFSYVSFSAVRRSCGCVSKRLNEVILCYRLPCSCNVKHNMMFSLCT